MGRSMNPPFTIEYQHLLDAAHGEVDGDYRVVLVEVAVLCLDQSLYPRLRHLVEDDDFGHVRYQ